MYKIQSLIHEHHDDDVIPLCQGDEKLLAVALDRASHMQSIHLVKRLIESKVNVNKTTFYGWTPLMRVAMRRNPLVNPATKEITHFSTEDHREMIELLLYANANINLMDDEGRTALYWASIRNPDIVKYLIQRGAKL